MGNNLSRRHHGHHGHGSHNNQNQGTAMVAQNNGHPYGQYPAYLPRPVTNGRMYGNYPTHFPEQYPGRYQPPQSQRQGGPHAGAPYQQQQQHVQQQQHTQQGQTELQQTKTIRNQVNLRKSTLRVEPREGEESLLTPTFKFDASAPCSVTIFFMAKEDADRACRLTTKSQKPGARITYEKGLGLIFPPPGQSDVAKSHSLDLSFYQQSSLTNLSLGRTDVYPIVIRLETITDKGMQEGHRLEELEPGCSTPNWVQSQTTYASLVKEEDGTWEARPLRQKIWVENVSYELQEIYGIQDIYAGDKKEKSATTLSTAYSEDLEGRECVICLASVRDTTVLPCRHMCMCEACARELQRQQVSRCPICRDIIESLLHIKRPEKKGAEKKEDSSADKASRTRSGHSPTGSKTEGSEEKVQENHGKIEEEPGH